MVKLTDTIDVNPFHVTRIEKIKWSDPESNHKAQYQYHVYVVGMQGAISITEEEYKAFFVAGGRYILDHAKGTI